MAEVKKSSSSSDQPGLEILKSTLDANPSIEFVRFQWIDFTASVRTRLVTVRQALHLATHGLSISVANPLVSAFLLDGSFHEARAGQKDSLVPDWSTLTICHYQPGHAAVLCFIDEAGHGFDNCPRSVLKRVEREIAEKHQGMSFLVGVEIEFYLTASAESTSPVKDITPYCSTASLRTPCLAVLEDSVRWLEQANIPVWTFHSELVAGLFEISIEPLTPLRAADAIVYIHEAIKSAAVKHGLHATMHPKPFDKTHGVGQHLHISLSPPSSSGKLEEKNHDSFLSGVLPSVPAISAISMPNYDSYLRSDFAGGEWVSWDTENRFCSIRKIAEAYWEFRFIDCTANNYLALAAILGCGIAAWAEERELTIKPMGGKSSIKLDEETRKALGLEKTVPRGLGEAVSALKGDEAVKRVFGGELVERFVKYKEHEVEVLGGLSLGERRALTMAVF